MRWWLVLMLGGCDAVFGIHALPPPDGSPATDAASPPGTWTQLAVGERHACGIDGQGRLACWGAADVGETGTGSASLVPVEVPSPEAAPWTQVTAGGLHGCGITAGHAYCWGANDQGQTTGVVTPPVLSPVRVTLPVGASPTIDQIAAGVWHTCAIAGGRLWCWGAQWQGGATSSAPVEIVPGKSDWVAVSAGVNHSCAIDRAGGVACWGTNDHGQTNPGQPASATHPTPVGLPGPAFAVSAGNAASCAIVGTAPQGTVVCWGTNDVLQANAAMDTGPVVVLDGADWTSVSVGTHGVCAVHAGQAVCWGKVDHGGLGDGQWREAIAPSAVVHTIPADDVTLATSYEDGESGCARESGNAFCWGDNAGGQLGTAATLHALPVTIPGTWKAVASGGAPHTCALDGSGGLWCWGANDDGQVTGTPGADQPAPALAAPSAQQLIAGIGYTCAVESGAVACWGTNAGGQLGTADPAAHQATPIASGITSLIGGTRAACASGPEGQVCWGTILGSGTFFAPQRLANVTVSLDDVGFGRTATCGAASGERVCWGYGYWGDLGDGMNHTDTSLHGPFTYSTEGTYRAVALTNDHACALVDDTSAGTVKCWGTNYDYDSANNANPYVLSPATLEDANAVPVTGCSSIAVSDAFSCAVCTSGVQCWGLAQMGRLGRGDNAVNSEPAAPVHMPTTGPWQEVALGPDHGCAIGAGGTLACWGLGARGEIGDGSHGSAVPVPVPGLP